MRAGAPADRLEAAGFALQPTAFDKIDVYDPSGRLVASVHGDQITLLTTRGLAHHIVSVLIGYYVPYASAPDK